MNYVAHYKIVGSPDKLIEMLGIKSRVLPHEYVPKHLQGYTPNGDEGTFYAAGSQEAFKHNDPFAWRPQALARTPSEGYTSTLILMNGRLNRMMVPVIHEFEQFVKNEFNGPGGVPASYKDVLYESIVDFHSQKSLRVTEESMQKIPDFARRETQRILDTGVVPNIYREGLYNEAWNRFSQRYWDPEEGKYNLSSIVEEPVEKPEVLPDVETLIQAHYAFLQSVIDDRQS